MWQKQSSSYCNNCQDYKGSWGERITDCLIWRWEVEHISLKSKEAPKSEQLCSNYITKYTSTSEGRGQVHHHKVRTPCIAFWSETISKLRKSLAVGEVWSPEGRQLHNIVASVCGTDWPIRKVRVSGTRRRHGTTYSVSCYFADVSSGNLFTVLTIHSQV